jgi:hypothetical protein
MIMDKNLLRRLAGIPTNVRERVTVGSAETSNRARVLAGLKSLPIMEDKDEDEELNDKSNSEKEEDKEMDIVDDETTKDEEASESEDDELPEIIKDLAAQAAGKSDEELEELMIQIYKAGVKDGEENTAA